MSELSVVKVPYLDQTLSLYWRPGKMSDMSVIKEVLVKKVYGRKNINLADGVWLDAGAHIGTFSIACRVAGCSKVYAFEPHPENYKLLRANLKLNGITRVTTFRKALVADPGVSDVPLKLAPKSTSFHSTYQARRLSSRKMETITVPAIYIIDFLQNHPEITGLKLDIEGEEIPILELLQCAQIHRINQVVFEWDFKHESETSRLREVVKKLKKCGFSVEVKDAKTINSVEHYTFWPSGVLVWAKRECECPCMSLVPECR